MKLDAQGIAETWEQVLAHLGLQIDAERFVSVAAALGEDPATAWANARRELEAQGAPVDVVRRALFALFGVVTDLDPALAEQVAPALALLAGAPSLAMMSPSRHSLGRDLLERVHDGPLQDAIALQLRFRRDPAMSEVHSALTGLVSSLRSVLADAHPSSGNEATAAGRDMALEAQLAAAARRCTWAHVTMRCQVPDGLSDEIADLALRVVRESLANLRHADATSARVDVRAVGETLWVHVEDDGVGFDSRRPLQHRPGHLGLPWLRDVVASGGGTFNVRSAPGLGTRITVELPLGAHASSPHLTTTLSA